MFKVQSAAFITSAPTLSQCPDWELPEIAMVGRSNVGKSSLINCLLNRKNLAKTSNTPGKTRLINFYRITSSVGEFALVDLPGYGYAKVSKAMQQDWDRHMTAFLQKRSNLVGALQLIDARHAPQPADLQMLAWLRAQEILFKVVLTKVDKISRNDSQKQVVICAKALGVSAGEVIVFSAETGFGKDALWGVLADMLIF